MIVDNRSIDFKTRELTETVKRLLFDVNKGELAVLLNMTRVTLNSRLLEHTWTYREFLIINDIKK